MGVTAGARVPAFTICFRSSMYCRQSRSPRMSYGLCSISNTTPSYGAALMACAALISGTEKVTKAGLPCSRALIAPFRRGVSAMVLLLCSFELGTREFDELAVLFVVGFDPRRGLL